jgi:acyl carrier protein
MPRDDAKNLAALCADVDALAGANLETVLATLPNWDSLAVLLTISHFEHTHAVGITATQLRSCRTVRDLLAHLPP